MTIGPEGLVDLGVVLQIDDDLLQQLLADLPAGDLAPLEDHGELHLVSFGEEFPGMPRLEIDVVSVGAGMEADLLELPLRLALALGLVPFLLLVAKLPKVDDSTDRWCRLGRDLDKVELPFPGNHQCLTRRHDTDLPSLLIHHAYLEGTDVLVDTRSLFARRDIWSISKYSCTFSQCVNGTFKRIRTAKLRIRIRGARLKLVSMSGKYLLPLLLSLILVACSDEPGAPPPVRLALTPATLDFGPVLQGTSLVMPVTVRNNGESETRVAAFSLLGDDAAEFSVVESHSFAIGPGQENLIEIRFSPTDLGRKHATLQMIGGSSDTLRVALTGLGTGSVIARLVSAPPIIDGSGDDAAWGVPSPLSLRFEQLADLPDGFSSESRRAPFDGELRALYTADSLYILLRWMDPSAEVTPDIWRRDNTAWSRTKRGEDGASLIFPITPALAEFDRKGCAVSCHAPLSLDRYEEGHRPENGAIDLWYWQAGHSPATGTARDQIANASLGGRRDDMPGGQPEPNYSTTGSEPLRNWGGTNGGLDPSRFLWKPTSAAFQPAGTNPLTGQPWRNGDSIPGWLLLPYSPPGSSVRARGAYMDGSWSVEFARALSTGEESDLEFDIRHPYQFSIAVHDRQRKFTPEEYAALPSLPNPSHYGIYLIGLIFD